MSEPLHILAIDTATGPCSAAVWAGGKVISYRENIKPTQQSASLMPMVEEALDAAGMGYGDITRVACTTGPGSFTGIRVGLAAASGIAFAAGIEGAGFTSLEVLAFGALEQAQGEPILVVLNAGKGEVYYQAFASAPFTPLMAPSLGAVELAAACVASPALQCGNIPLLPGMMDAGIAFPRADALAGLAASMVSVLPLRPFYIRGPDAKLPAERVRIT